MQASVAKAYFKIGQYEKAAADLRKAMAIDFFDPSLGDVMKQVNERMEKINSRNVRKRLKEEKEGTGKARENYKGKKSSAETGRRRSEEAKG